MLSELIENASEGDANIYSIVAIIRESDLNMLQLPDNNGEKLLFKALSRGLECDGDIITTLIVRLCINADNFKNLNSYGDDVIKVIFNPVTQLSDYHRIKILQLLFQHIKFTREHLHLKDEKGQTLLDFYSRFLPPIVVDESIGNLVLPPVAVGEYIDNLVLPREAVVENIGNLFLPPNGEGEDMNDLFLPPVAVAEDIGDLVLPPNGEDMNDLFLPPVGGPTYNKQLVFIMLDKLGYVEQVKASDTDSNGLVCQICVEHHKNVSLNCGHAFCCDCIRKNTELNHSLHVKCPHCARTIVSVMRLYL
jgi:hypothetical protein